MRSYNMEILNARYTASGSINALVDGTELSIPAVGGNRHYDALIEQGIDIAPYVEPEPAPPTEEQARAERNRLLAASDWTQLPDAPVDQASWATYRQALRDITAQQGFPENVIWPTPPE
jgi:hypothetical protein